MLRKDVLRCFVRCWAAQGTFPHNVLGSAAHCLSSVSASKENGLPPAFVFDMDGVLVKGKKVIPEARQALQKLYTEDGMKPKFPVCFLTNSGGMKEETRADQLSGWLDVHVNEQQVVLAHTPMQELVPRLGNVPVVLSGRGDIESVAKHYGFKFGVTTEQIGLALPSATPFSKYEGKAKTPCPVNDQGLGSESNPFRAVLVFTDPSDWARDLQLLVDVVKSNGVLKRSEPPQSSSPVEVYISHQDLLWANDFPCPRFGQGAFALAFRELYKAYTKTEPNIHYFGKPNVAPYRLIENRLLQQYKAMGLTDAPKSSKSTQLGSVYMVGDNPAADVRGARNAGRPWLSVLVRTGVFKGLGNSEEDPADFVYKNVLEFVESAAK